jgi:hypothetical protein
MVPRPGDFPLDRRADLGLTEFDRLVRLLHQLTEPSVRMRILDALEADGRDTDVGALAAAYGLSASAVRVVDELAAFGDQGESVHAFGAVHVAQINAGSLVGHCDLTTVVLARRQRGRIAYWFQDENGGCGHLGCRDQPLSLLEAIVLVDATLVAQAPYPVSGGDWRSGFLSDSTMQVRVRSRLFPELHAWYDAAIAEWSAAESR